MSPDARVLDIARLGAQGDGVADCEDRPVYVPFALPGERVRAEVDGERARLLEVLEPASNRVSPVCRHFGACGGCALQHLEPGDALAWKRAQVVAAFAARGIEAEVDPPIAIGLGERRRATFAAARADGSAVRLGFHAAREHDIVPLAECPILTPAIEQALAGLAELAEPLLPRREAARILVTDTDTGLDIAIEGVERKLTPNLRSTVAAAATRLKLARLSVGGDVVFASAEPALMLGGVRLVPPPAAFLQASAKAEAAIAAIIVAAARAAKAKAVADLFCGVGTFAFHLARHARVLAVDGDKRAIGALSDAARRASGLKAIETKVRDLMREPLSARELQEFGAVVFDPPRAGARAQAEMLAKSKVPAVVAVSCNPGTLARDARILIDGGYTLQRVVPIDQFVHSAHIEAVAVFRR